MATLHDIFRLDAFENMIEQGYVRVQTHPEYPLSVVNYSQKAVYERVWNKVTRNCRGLVYHSETFEVVSRCLPKFFNYSEPDAAQISLDEEVIVTDKLDGSLILVSKYHESGPIISTRGSFMSEQAIHAREIWSEKYYDFQLPDNTTLIFEVIYPANKIVVSYTIDDLVLLGAIHNETGQSISPDTAALMFDWTGPVAKTFDYTTLAQALAAPPRENAEGLVVHAIRTDERIKIKQEDYVLLHALVTNLSERSIWEAIIEEKSLEEILEPLPDEFHEWTREVYRRLHDEVADQELDIRESYAMIRYNLKHKYGYLNWTRKEFAQEITHRSDSWALFLLLDGQVERMREKLWKLIKPEAYLTPARTIHNEDDS